MAPKPSFMPRELFLSLMVCVFYGTVSLALGLVNKAVLSSYSFNCIFLLLTTQMLLQVIMCTVSRDYMGNPAGLPKYDKVVHLESLTVGFAYVANVAVGMLGVSASARVQHTNGLRVRGAWRGASSLACLLHTAFTLFVAAVPCNPGRK